MKKILHSSIVIVIIVALIVFMATIFNTQKTEASKLTSKKVSIKIVSVSKEKIEIEMKNSTKETFVTTGKFVLKKKKNGKWEEVKFKSGVLFAKTVTVQPNSRRIKTIKWEDYFGKELSAGEYKIEFINSKKFEIINDNTESIDYPNVSDDKFKEIPFKYDKDKWITEIDETLSFQRDSVVKQLNMNGLCLKMAWNISITMWLCL